MALGSLACAVHSLALPRQTLADALVRSSPTCWLQDAAPWAPRANGAASRRAAFESGL
ncbi:hypothetical protein PF010_g15544 [Phytophthora fragariae]|uniref:Uncharacterized protein n=1 Tax=Phytophthora fragariae TaxID=53985 RepID=A0A6A3JKN8_9STRA|nr:hypothetical protein PF011_g16645 [Phytophthora fragariae]KAE9098478.1 hypothetical protein PF010_g15544 [Phytophthora fragariae]KAE9211813.1 hypothetical protein PF004_g15807 [Phytophthora fragariae]